MPMPVASHNPNKDNIYRTPLNEKLGGKRRWGEDSHNYFYSSMMDLQNTNQNKKLDPIDP